MGDQDKGYKKLFSNKELVRDLLEEFVDSDIVSELDLSLACVQRVNSSYVTDDVRERIDDIVWRIGFRGSDLFLCILVEFQSTEDRWMAPRILSYIGLLYQDLIKADILTGGKELPRNRKKLPPVLPIVLHTGRTPWKAPCSLGELVELSDSPLLAFYTPTMKYLLLDVPAYEAERLAESENLAVFLMRIERTNAPEELLQELRRMRGALRTEENAHLRRDFSIFISKVLLPKKTGKADFPETHDLLEVERMILEGKHEWAENWLKQGEERGIRLGEEKTKRENALRMLEGGLSVADIAKFVDLPEEEVHRLAAESRH